MNRQKDAPNLEDRPKTKFFCCGCIPRRKASSSSTTINVVGKNEPYEYVVEKLAIKKVPLSLFATDEDLERHAGTASSHSTTTPSIRSQKLEKGVKAVDIPIKEKGSVTFSTYYKFTPRTDIERVSRTRIPPRDESDDDELHYESEKETREQRVQQQKSRKKALTEEQEKELVTQVLNKHSSLFTLDPKEPVPKDPDNLPRAKAVVPPTVHAALHGRRSNFPPLQGGKSIQVEIHRTSTKPDDPKPSPLPPVRYPAIIPISKKELTPELKKTINALGVAQKPRLPGVPPKNQRNISETVCDYSTEQEIGCRIFDQVLEEMSSEEMGCLALEAKKKAKAEKFRCPRKKRLSITDTSGDDTELDSSAYSTSKLHFCEGTIPFEKQYPKTVTIQQCETDHDNKSVLAVPDKSIRFLPIHESVNTSEPHMQDSEQITEISQMKGQSLKWKIIIKHHSDKKKENGGGAEKSDDSDNTDTDSKQYILDCKRALPNR